MQCFSKYSWWSEGSYFGPPYFLPVSIEASIARHLYHPVAGSIFHDMVDKSIEAGILQLFSIKVGLNWLEQFLAY